MKDLETGPTSVSKIKNIIVFDLYQDNDLERLLIRPFIASTNEDGQPIKWKRLATPENVAVQTGLGDITNITPLLKTCLDLDPQMLYEKYKPKGRKKHTWKDIYAIKELKTQVDRWIDNKLSGVLKEIADQQLHMTENCQRDAVLSMMQLQFSTTPLKPKLFFTKTENGLTYKLNLIGDDTQIIPVEHEVAIVTNKPGWVIIDKVLYPLADLNGNKLKPFISKEVIHIKPSLIQTYFQKFILEVAEKAEIEAEGFKVEEQSDIKSSSLILTYDFIKKIYVFKILFDYGPVTFVNNNPSRYRKLLNLNENDVSIDVVSRDMSKEQAILSKLMSLGLTKTEANCYHFYHEEDSMATITWLIEHKAQIESCGFVVKNLVLNQKPLQLLSHELTMKTEASGDWFDIHAEVEIGEYVIPFQEFLPNIKEGDRLFKLPDESVFVIPLLWMTKYLGLSRHGELKSETIKIRKSQFGLLQDTDDDKDMRKVHALSINEIKPHQPSSKLKAKLRPYQARGVSWLIQRYEEGLGACLADDMGLGKTLQTIAALVYAKELVDPPEQKSDANRGQMDLFSVKHEIEIKPLRSLIVMPASLIFNWAEEIKQFAPHLHVCRLVGNKRKALFKTIHTFDVVLTSYETALRDKEVLKEVDWTYIVLDESQKIKNHQSKIFQAINELQATACITLTGTPIENSLKDLWSQMQFLNPEILGEFSFFKKHYLIPIEKQQDEAVMDDLRRIIQPFILRRTKSVVAKDLPELTEQLCYADMTKAQSDLYEKEKNAARNFLLSSDPTDQTVKFKVFASLMKLRQIANHPVMAVDEYEGGSGKYEEIKDKLTVLHKSGHKTLIFSSFTGHLKLISAFLNEQDIAHHTLTGSTPAKQREQYVKSFQEDEGHSCFLISIKAGGVGLNLTNADYVMILDPWWNPFIEEQAIARAHRIGQSHPVHVLRMISKESIEEKILKLQQKKKALFKDLIDINSNPSVSREDLIHMLT